MQRIALVIGNANYPDADPPLTQPTADARLLADELKASGFEVELVENLTKQQLQEVTDRFTAKVRPGTAALLYFGGIGIQSGRQNYMIPVNAQIWAERDVARDGISIESVLGDIADSGMAVKLAIVDASRRNPFERRFRNAPAGLAPIVAPTNTLAMSAAGLGQVVNEGSGKNSLFMTELLKELRGGVVTLEEVFSRARIGVSRASDGEQVPWVSSTLMDSHLVQAGGRAAPDAVNHSSINLGSTTLSMAQPSPTPTTAPDDSGKARERDLVNIVRDLVRELRSGRGGPVEVTLSSRLDRDLGIDSLGRTELVLRLERAFARAPADPGDRRGGDRARPPRRARQRQCGAAAGAGRRAPAP